MRKTFMSNPVVITLGCRLNTFESEVMRRHAEAAGIEDAIIVNTCAVTGEAVRQAAQTVRKLRRDKPEARIIVTGCAAQIEPERFADMPEVDHVIGNAEKMRGETFEGLSTSSSERVQVNDIMSVRECAPHMIDGICLANARLSCRFKMAAIIAARFASFHSGAAPHARCPLETWSHRCAAWSKAATRKSC